MAANIYKGEPLKIFDVTEENAVDAPRLTTWETLQEKEFKLALTHPPENVFQEMIMWTEQGKLWKFPIDNEQGTLNPGETLIYTVSLTIV